MSSLIIQSPFNAILYLSKPLQSYIQILPVHDLRLSLVPASHPPPQVVPGQEAFHLSKPCSEYRLTTFDLLVQTINTFEEWCPLGCYAVWLL
jgi:hypothetical protein